MEQNQHQKGEAPALPPARSLNSGFDLNGRFGHTREFILLRGSSLPEVEAAEAARRLRFAELTQRSSICPKISIRHAWEYPQTVQKIRKRVFSAKHARP